MEKHARFGELPVSHAGGSFAAKEKGGGNAPFFYLVAAGCCKKSAAKEKKETLYRLLFLFLYIGHFKMPQRMTETD